MNFKEFDYPNNLNKIFDKLELLKIKPIIIGGYVRDKLLQITSKDIDIELYGINSLELLENILQEFGSVNNVGRSFGVCKLSFEGLDIDFSLPRRDSKVKNGHKGFEISTDSTLDFTTATSRRDFTINAIGYDVKEKKLLDPFKGLADLNAKILRAVNLGSFGEDPLRVLRAIQFSARLNFKLERGLILLSQDLVKKGTIEELAPQRVYEEIQKLLLKSEKPSIGFMLIKELHLFNYFKEFNSLSPQNYLSLTESLDKYKKLANKKVDTMLMLTLICSYMSEESRLSFLVRLTNSKDILEGVTKYSKFLNLPRKLNYSNYEVYTLATKVNIELLCSLLGAKFPQDKESTQNLLTQADSLGVKNTPLKAFIQGKELIKLGLKPSKEFSKILERAYKAQLQKKFCNYDEAIEWLKSDLL